MTSVEELLGVLANGAEFVSLDELLDMFEDHNDIVYGDIRDSIKKSVPRDEYFTKDCTRKINKALREVLRDVLETLADAGVNDLKHRERREPSSP